MKTATEAVTAVPLGAHQRAWQSFLAGSVNGTLFHDLEFLRYHPVDRFHFQHILLTCRGELVALFPGGLMESGNHKLFCSPLGASIGGLIVAAPLGAELALAMVESLQNYAHEQGWKAIQITLPPSYYSFDTADTISFALFCRGFRLEHRWLCPALQLDTVPNAFERKYRSRQAVVCSSRATQRRALRRGRH